METVNTVATVFAAIGTVVVAILAIWGDWVKAKIAGPILELKLRDERGNLTVRADEKRTAYYHVQITNKRRWSPAKNVRILVTGIEKKQPDGTYLAESLVAPLQLTWAPPQFHELLPTISSSDVSDLGFLDEDSGRFELSLYITPNNFRGFVEQGESMRLSITASAHNYESETPLVLEISWDGVWDSNMDELQKHLVIKKVS